MINKFIFLLLVLATLALNANASINCDNYSDLASTQINNDLIRVGTQESKSYKKYTQSNLNAYTLSLYQYVAIQRYIASEFESINSYLRCRYNPENQSGLDYIRSLTANLLQALDQMPARPARTYRGTFMRTEMLETFSKVGDIYTDKAFLSTSRNPYVSAEFAYQSDNSEMENTHSRVFFVIDGHSGRNLDDISGVHTSLTDNEEEILYKPSTRFKVISITKETVDFQALLDSWAEEGEDLSHYPTDNKKEVTTIVLREIR